MPDVRSRRPCREYVSRALQFVACPGAMLLVGWIGRATGHPTYLLLLPALMAATAILCDMSLAGAGIAAGAGVAAVVVGGRGDALAVAVGIAATLGYSALFYRLVSRYRLERDNLTRVRRLVSRIPGSLEPSNVLDAIVRTATEALNAKAASIRLLTEDGQRLEIRATYGLSEAYLAKGDVRLEDSELDRQVLKGQVMRIADATRDKAFQYREAAAAEGIASVLCVPLCVRTHCYGVLRVYTAQTRSFSEAEISLLSTFAAVAAIALEQARSHQTAMGYMRKAAHELRSPLCTVQTIVHGAAQGITGQVDEQTRGLLDRAAKRVTALLALLDDLLSLSRMYIAPVSECEPVDFREAIQSVVELHEPQAEAKAIAFQADLPAGAVFVRATRQHLEDLARNLVSNAVKYTPTGGAIAVTLTVAGGKALLTVADTGIGIPPEDVALLGAEFHRSSLARQSGAPGTGLGLSIVKSLLDRYGGRLSVDSEVGRGTTFTIELPTSDAPASKPAA